MFFIGNVKYSLINPNPPPDFFGDFITYFIYGTAEELESQMNSFASDVGGSGYHVNSQNVMGNFYFLGNKENIVQVISGYIGFEALIGDLIVEESPRDSWSHGH